MKKREPSRKSTKKSKEKSSRVQVKHKKKEKDTQGQLRFPVVDLKKEKQAKKPKKRKHIQIEEEEEEEKEENVQKPRPLAFLTVEEKQKIRNISDVDSQALEEIQEIKKDETLLSSPDSFSFLASSVLANEKSNFDKKSTTREENRNLFLRSASRSPSPSFLIDLTEKSKLVGTEKEKEKKEKKEKKKKNKSLPKKTKKDNQKKSNRKSFTGVVTDSEEEIESQEKDSSTQIYEIDFLSKTNAYKRNQDLKFQSAGHLYFIKGFSVDVLPDDPLYVEYKQQGERFKFVDENGVVRVRKGPLSNRSSSEMYKIFMPESSTSSRIANVLRSHQINNPSYKYYKKTVEWMEKTWKKTGDVAKDSGTEMHNRFEIFSNLYVQEKELTKLWIPTLGDKKRENIENKHWLLWAKNEMENKNLEPFYTEIPMFCEEHRVTGSADLLLQKIGDKTWPRHVVIADYKRSCKPLPERHEVYTSHDFYQYGLGPFAETHNTTYWHYAVQLNLYKYMLEKYYNLVVDEMYLLCIHPDLPSYVKKEVPNMQEHIEEMLKIRKECLERNIYLEDYLNDNDREICEKRRRQDEIDNLCVENQRSLDEENKNKKKIDNESENLNENE